MDGFKDIPGFEGIYAINKEGQILQRERLLPISINKGGYPYVSLYKGKSYVFNVHSLLAMTFIPNPHNKPEVNHKNRNRKDNSLENLEWVTRSENQLHKWTNPELKEKCYDYMQHLSKRIGQYKGDELIREFRSIGEVVRILGLNYSHISSCANGKRKTHGGFYWKFI